MTLYLRLLRESEPNTYSAEEQQHLHSCLERIPGVQRVLRLEQHIKGGYAVSLEYRGAPSDELHAAILAAGYREVI